MISASFPSLLQSFFTDRLLRQRQASPHTIAGYRDCFRLLLDFAKERLGKIPSQLRIEDLDAPFVCLFLDHLEGNRKNTPARGMFDLEPSTLLSVRGFRGARACLALPEDPGGAKQTPRTTADRLSRPGEIDALLAIPNPSTWLGRRDRTLLLVAVQTGLRVSELIGLNCQDVALGTGAHVRCLGKGRKQRCTPLRPETAKMVDANEQVSLQIRSFPASGETDLVATRLSISSPSTPIVLHRPALRLEGSESPRMSVDTPQRWTFFIMALVAR